MALDTHHAPEQPKAVSSLRFATAVQDCGHLAQLARAKTIFMDDHGT
jgi:hypothetical protein